MHKCLSKTRLAVHAATADLLVSSRKANSALACSEDQPMHFNLKTGRGSPVGILAAEKALGFMSKLCVIKIHVPTMKTDSRGKVPAAMAWTLGSDEKSRGKRKRASQMLPPITHPTTIPICKVLNSTSLAMALLPCKHRKMSL